MEDAESVKAPSLSSDSCSEGEDDNTPVREVCNSLMTWSYLMCCVWMSFLKTTFPTFSVRMNRRWCPRSWHFWRIMGKISSCPTRTWLPPGCPATTRDCWSQRKLFPASNSFRCVREVDCVCLCLRDQMLISSALLQFQIDRLNPSWTSSLSLGVIGHSPDRLNFPSTACCLKRSVWLLQRDSVFHNSLKVTSLPWVFYFLIFFIYVCISFLIYSICFIDFKCLTLLSHH